MDATSSFQPREILNYTRFDSNTSLSDIDIPESAQNREKTDKKFLIFSIICLLTLVPFLIYTLSNSDINRLKGYDSCGNVCGEKNVRYYDYNDDEWSCTGKDMTNKPLYRGGTCEAITFENYFNNIIKQEEHQTDDFTNKINTEQIMKRAYTYFRKVSGKIALSISVSLGFCVFMVYLFRYATAAVVWGILILSWTLLFSFTTFVWTMVISSRASAAVYGASLLSIIVLLLLCLLIAMQKKIRLVILLFKESTKAVTDMAPILSIPIMTIIGSIIIISVCVVLSVLFSTSGILTKMQNGYFIYIPNSWMITTFVLNSIMTIWAIEFIGGIQYMIISGAVTKWYFTRDKTLLGSPILTSAFITIKFHLGTIALGSFIITLVTILRVIFRSLANNGRLKLFVICCMNYIEAFLKFFTKNAYIITAMHGTPFFTSGKQVVKLITLNVCNTIVVNNFVAFVLIMAQFLMIGLSATTTYLIFLNEENNEYTTFVYLAVILVTLLCCFIIFSTIQTAVDTMFLCFCEDTLINDGVNKPYAMSRGFMEFVESSKQVYVKEIQKKGLPVI